MKNQITVLVISAMLAACNVSVRYNESKAPPVSVAGTWRLLTGILIEKGDTVVTDYTKGREFIKIINNTHFAFLNHDLAKGRNPDSAFSSGGGSYSLKDSLYIEHLDFCSDRQWEGNEFHFVVNISNDTLVQRGVEKIDSIGVNRINIERYVRLKN